MEKKEIASYLGIKIKILCVFGSGQPIFYSGNINELKESSFDFLDKFGDIITITYDSVKQVSKIEN